MTSAQLLALLDCPATPDNRFAAETPAHWITAPVTDPAHPAAQAAARLTSAPSRSPPTSRRRRTPWSSSGRIPRRG